MKHCKQSRLVSVLRPLSVLALICAIFSLVWIRSGVVSLEYKLSSLDKKKQTLLRENKLLAAERANLMSVERFETAAAGGFSMPDRIRVVHVGKRAVTETRTASLSGQEGLALPQRLLRKIMN